MSQQAQEQLGAGNGKAINSKRKMTHAILEEQEKETKAYEFLEDDDEFEEFEINNDELMMDVEMTSSAIERQYSQL